MTSTFNVFVDAVQAAKTQFVKNFAHNDEIKKPLQTYIDAQAAFAKHMIHETFCFMSTVGNAMQNFDAKKAWPSK